MEQTYDNSQLDQSALQNLLGGSTPSLIPESLVTTLTVGFIVLNVLGILFMIFYVFSIVRKWRVESAMLHMQKDVAEIKEALLKQNNSSLHSSQSIPQPGQSSQSIARSDDSSGNTLA